ncbi:MAG: gliding motility-associated C-terminal domain-containing protein, partial [Flavobacteriaceae bacterium]|nr:gliding motility-associated C-terminal domain-containing protein [Flavobacteriaceae bacterium]
DSALLTDPAPYKYTVLITDKNAPYCESSTAEGTVTVNPLPAATIIGSASPVCIDDIVEVTFTGSLGTAPYTFTYNINGGTIQTVTSSGTTIIVPVNTITAGVFIYNLESVSDANGCSQLINESATITVLPPPSLTIIDPLPICEGDTIDLKTTIIPFDSGLTYTYHTGITADATNEFSSSVVTAGTYYIKATYNLPPACSTIAEVVVTSVPLPTVTVNNSVICEGDLATITATPSIAGSYNYNWTVPSGVPSPGNVASFTLDSALLTDPAPYKYTVLITDKNAPYCESSTAEGIVTVNLLPTATITSSPIEVCLGAPATIEFKGDLGTGPYIFEITGPSGTQTLTGDPTATLDVLTTTSGIFTYTLVSVRDANTNCEQTIGESVTITVRDLPTVVIDNGSSVDVCEGQPVTLTASGASNYIWYTSIDTNGDPINLDINTDNEYTFTPILTPATYYVQGTDSNGCMNIAQIEVNVIDAVEGFIKAPYDFVVCKDASLQPITFEGTGSPGFTFTYAITLGTATIFTGSVTTTTNTAELTPPIPTGTAGIYEVTLTGVASGSCGIGTVIQPNQAFITILDAGIAPITLINVNQTVCEGIPIDPIDFKIEGDATEAYVTGLPIGITGVIDAGIGVFKIEGSSDESGEFEYTVYTSDPGLPNSCVAEFTGTITINPNDSITLLTDGTENQSICEGDTIASISYELGGGATGTANAYVTGLPVGVSYDISSNILTISGSVSNLGSYPYTVETSGSCKTTSLSGTLTITESVIDVNPSSIGTPDQTICINNAIEDIEFSITTTPSIVPAVSLVLVGTLPVGVAFDSSTGIISGTPTEGGTFPYTIEASTGCATPYAGEIIVNDTLPIILIENGLTDIEVCEGSEITLTATGADTYEWYELDASGAQVNPYDKSNQYTFIATKNTVIYVDGTSVDGCMNTAQINVTLKSAISATIAGVNSFEVCKDETTPTITFTGINGIAPYTFTYTINGIANTVSSINTEDTALIGVPTNIAGEFIIQLIDVVDASGSTSTYCSPTLLEPKTATITVVASGIQPQANTPIYQTICEGDSITGIKFEIQGDATDAYAEGLPNGITASFAGNTLTISGTPTVTGVFNYTVFTSGLASGCNASFEGTITINPNDSITLLSEGNELQEICVNSSIAPITYQLGGGATGATIIGLPDGITWSINGNILTIKGSSSATPAIYTYTITTQGICGSESDTGEIEITIPISIDVPNGTTNEFVCINTRLPNSIIYQSSDATSTLILNGVLPPGVSFVSGNKTGNATISGTPTQIGTYNYSISSDSGCSEVVEGSIVVEGDAFINLNSNSSSINQVACVGTPIEAIKYNIPFSVSQAAVTFTPTLPIGINYVVVDGELIISGTSEVLSETTYKISVTSKCGSASTEFTLTIEESPTITLEADSGTVTQSVCQNGDITPIRFTVSPIGTKIDEDLLPSFIDPPIEIDPSLGLWELTGAPLSTGTFNFEIKTLGDSNCSASLFIQIENLYAAVSVVLDAGSESQTLCSFNDPIEDIVYNITGSISNSSIINVTGLPGGITGTATSTASGILFTISGQPTESGIFEYELKYDTCGTLKTGVIEISSPMTINGTVTQISCIGDVAKISVKIFGGVPFVDEIGNPLYAINWKGPNGFKQNQNTITGLLPGDYTISGTDAIGCAIPTTTYTIEPLTPLSIDLLDKTVATGCDGTLGCANFKYLGGTGIYTSFLLEYLNPQSQNWKIKQALNNNYYNICDLEAGLYRITVTDSGGCETEPFMFTVENGSQFSIENLVLEESLCNGETGIILIEVNSIDPNLIFEYNGNVVTSTALGNNFYELQINAGIGTNGVITVTNFDGCTLSKEITLKTMDPDFEFTSVEFENHGYFKVNFDIGFTNLNFIDSDIYDPNVYTYIEWDFDDNTPFKTFYYPDDLASDEDGESIKTVSHKYTTDGIYNVTLTLYNTAGCSTSITKTIIVGEGASILLPTVFTPNNDNINDLFRPLFRGISEISMYIYDNWGNLVYEYTSENATALEKDKEWGWNGIEPLNSEPKNGNYRCYILAKTLGQKVIEKNIRFLIIQ